MKKILFLAVFAFVMSSCSKKASPQKATILNATENFLPYDFATKKIVDDNGGPKKVQFKIDSAITVSQTVRVDYVNDRGDVADSNKLETRFIPAGTECLLADDKDGKYMI
jgi:PBP1b-binding outer membrane lipoprotein LpoB